MASTIRLEGVNRNDNDDVRIRKINDNMRRVLKYAEEMSENAEKGDKGDPGEKGDKGDKGDPGEPESISISYILAL